MLLKIFLSNSFCMIFVFVQHDKCIEEDSAFYGDMHPLYDAIYDIVVMTSDYEHDYDSDKDLQS